MISRSISSKLWDHKGPSVPSAFFTFGFCAQLFGQRRIDVVGRLGGVVNVERADAVQVCSVGVNQRAGELADLVGDGAGLIVKTTLPLTSWM